MLTFNLFLDRMRLWSCVGFWSVKRSNMMVSRILSLGISGTGAFLSGIAVCYSINRRRYKNPFEVAYLNLSISDFIFSSRKFLDTLLCEGHVTSQSCIISYFVLARILWNSNLLSILPLVVDRAIAVLYPLKYKTTSHKKINIALIVSCWVLSSVWWLSQYLFVMKPPLSYKKSDKRLKSITWYTEAVIFMILPSVFNCLSFIAIIYHLHKRAVIRRMSMIITILKSLLCTILFTVSWMPIAISALKEGKARLQIFLYINTITDPFIYLMPNRYVKRVIQRCKGLAPTVKSDTSVKTK